MRGIMGQKDAVSDDRQPRPEALKCGAGDRARTDDILLGRQMLYQLSYTRASFLLYHSLSIVTRRSERKLSWLAVLLARQVEQND